MEATGAPVRFRLCLYAGAGQRGFVRREKAGFVFRCCRPGGLRNEVALCRPFGICELVTLAEGFQPARLETRTKESNMYASRWVENP